MSRANLAAIFDRQVSDFNQLLETSKETAYLRGVLRKKLERNKGQIFVLEQDLKEFHKAVGWLLGKYEIGNTDIGEYIPPDIARAAYLSGQVQARKQHDQFKTSNPDIHTAYAKYLETKLGITKGNGLRTSHFIVSSFGKGELSRISLERIIKAITDVIDPWLRTQSLVKELPKNSLYSLIEKGHGVGGEAVSFVLIAEAISALPEQYRNDITASIINEVKTLKLQRLDLSSIIKFLETEWVFIAEKGTVNLQIYTSIVAGQFGKENNLDAVEEKLVKQTVEKILLESFSKQFPNPVEDLLDVKGCLSIKDRAIATTLKSLTTIKHKKIKVQFDKNIDPKGLTALTKHKFKQTISSKNPFITMAQRSSVKPKKVSKPIKRKTRTSRISLQSLIPQINMNLFEKIKRNMGSPRLNYQTGRFAQSVKVTDIVQTPKGFPSIGYTYMKNPYQVYEKDSQRDPRPLIDKSIREIAIGLIQQRFYTRRI